MLNYREQTASYASLASNRRWCALGILCLGILMIELDTTIVNVALPSIREDLNFPEIALVWVVNGYMLPFGGFLLLGGRMGDLYGHRRLFLIGTALFTIASLACGLVNTRGLLIAARSLQGLGGAVVLAVAFALITNMFTEDRERLKAIGIYSFVCIGGSSIGLILSGALTSALNWHWIFLVNVPIGAVVCALCPRLLPKSAVRAAAGRLDVFGAVTVTTSLVLATYAILNVTQVGWTSTQTLALLACGIVSFVVFLVVEGHVKNPLIRLGIFRLRNFATANCVGILLAAVTWVWLFMAPLYMQGVLGYTPMQVGIAFLPANAIVAVFSLGLSARLVAFCGVTKPIGIGLLFAAIGLLLFAQAPLDGAATGVILPGMVCLGLGIGIAYNPLLLAATSNIAQGESGLASGIFNTASILGGALGLAILANVSTARANHALTSGASIPFALAAGYRVAFLLAAVCAFTAAVIGVALLRATDRTSLAESNY